MEKLKLQRHEIAAITGESLSIIDDAIAAGHLKSFLVGKRRFATPADVRKWIDYLRSESDAGRPVSYRARARREAALARASPPP